MRLYVEGGRGLDELHALHRWLVEDTETQQAVPRLRHDSLGPGGMGGGLEWIDFAVGTGLNVTAIVLAVAAWLRPRAAAHPKERNPNSGAGIAQTVKVLIEHDGTTLVLSGGSAEEVAAVLKALRQ